jgi:hypothetical protein
LQNNQVIVNGTLFQLFDVVCSAVVFSAFMGQVPLFFLHKLTVVEKNTEVL